jgi:hypothetical protein
MKNYTCVVAAAIVIAICAQTVGSESGRISHNPERTAKHDTGEPGAPDLITSPGWHQIVGTALKGGPKNASPCPPNDFNGYRYSYADACGGVIIAWSSATVDPQRNRLILWGGGHTDYAGNEIYSLELSANPPKLIRLNPPSPPNTTRACVETLSDGRPNSRHTYDSLAYLPNQDEMFSSGGSLNACGFAGNATWTLQLSSVLASCAPNCSAIWTKQNPKNVPAANYGITTAYDTVQNILWLNDDNNLWSYDPVANQFTKRASVSSCYHGTAVFDPADQYFIHIDGCTPKLSYWSTAGKSSLNQKNPAVDASCEGLFSSSLNGNSGYPGVVWDPIDKAVVAYPNAGNVLYLLHPKTWTCTTETYGSTQGVDYPQDNAPTEGGGTFKHFNYFPKLDLYVLCNDPRSDCWYLSRRRN